MNGLVRSSLAAWVLAAELVAVAAAAIVRTPLTSWTFRADNGSVRLENVTIPGSSHMHLLEHGVIPDPYHRYNEHELQWVAMTTWVYETTVDITALDRRLPHRLIFETLDGVAQVLLDGVPLGPLAVNAFHPHVYTLPSFPVATKTANLTVVFTPALDYTRRQEGRYPYHVAATRNYNVWAEPTARPFLRKAGADFGWDWGPAFIPCGLTGPVRIESGRGVDFADLDVRYAITGHNHVRGSVVAVLRTPGLAESERVPVIFRLWIDGALHGDPVAVQIRGSASGVVEVPIPFEIHNASLWWPTGVRDGPHLYEVRVVLQDAGEGIGAPSQELRHAVGFRTIELVQETAIVPDAGSSFFFRVNGELVFVKGANWIPTDAFPRRANSTRTTEALLVAAQQANMNMVRVWGGGRYESDAFYATCDRLGLLVWNELMFACAMYPRDDAFLATVETEVRHQVQRLRKYTSVAIWGGNNENEAMFDSFAAGDFMPPGVAFNRDVAVVDYTALFVDRVRPIVVALDPDRAFVDTSPSNGLEATAPYTKRWGRTTDGRFGDVHYYNYSGDCQDPATFPPARFVSEFGFQSLPSVSGLESVSDPEDWATFQSIWRLINFRERHANGTTEMLTQLARRFHVPFPWSPGAREWLGTPMRRHPDPDARDPEAGDPEAGDPEADKRSGAIRRRVGDLVFLTQVQQALCYETAIGVWRRDRATRGVLYWQLNDVWPGAVSWSSVEHGGRRKSLHYVLARALAPLVVTVTDHRQGPRRGLEVAVTSDLPSARTLALDYELRRTLDGGLVRRRRGDALRVPPQATARQDLDVDALFEGTPCAPTTCFLRVRATSDAGPDTVHFFAPYKDLVLSYEARVEVAAVELAPETNAMRVTLRPSTPFVALFVELEAPGLAGAWDRNTFHLVGNETATLTFTPDDGHDAPRAVMEDAARGLVVRWLQRVYDYAGPTMRLRGRQQRVASVA